jgi:chromate reductase
MVAKILALAGSTRADSFNKKLVQTAAAFAEKVGAAVTVIDLRDYPLPLYDGDLEESEGSPEHATMLYALFKSHDAVLISSPEYNSSISGVLKNDIDWISRPRDGEPPLAAFSGKVAGLLSASPGQLGGLRGLVHLRSILGNIGMVVIPEQVAVGAAHEAFAENGSLIDEKLAGRVATAMKSLVRTSSLLRENE